MTKTILAIALSFISLNYQAQWSQLSSGTSSDLNSIHFTDNNTGWVAGEHGLIRTTANGGDSWSAQTSGTSSELYSIYFTDSQNGWAAGENGVIRHTANGGATWNSQASGTIYDLYAIHFFDASNGLAAGETGVILRTINGGTSWTISVAGNGGSGSGSGSSSGTETELTDIQMTSLTTAYACGKGGYFLKSTDGGTNWTAQLTGVSEDFAALHFPSAETGYVAYELGKVKHTTGNGTFNSVYAATSKDLKGIWFVTDQKGWVVGDEGRILYTLDGGTTWSSQNLASVEEELNAVHFPSATTGYCAGKDGVILKMINADFVGVNENTEIQLNVYPNPATGSITISLNDQFSSGIATIIVTDAAGRIISESTSTENRLTLATENWKAGYYTIRLISGQQTATAKICKQ